MRRETTRKTLVALVATAVCLLIVPGASAQDNQFEFMIGNYWPSDIDYPVFVGGVESTASIEYKSDWTWGIRYGRKINDVFGIGIRWTTFDFNSARRPGGPDCGECKFDGDFADFSAEFYPKGGNFALIAGIGWVTSEFEVPQPGLNNNPKVSDDDFTFHLGLSYTFKLGEKFYLRPEYLFRYIDISAGDLGATYDDEDSQATLGLGWTF
jgi:hypothetical protein